MNCPNGSAISGGIWQRKSLTLVAKGIGSLGFAADRLDLVTGKLLALCPDQEMRQLGPSLSSKSLAPVRHLLAFRYILS